MTTKTISSTVNGGYSLSNSYVALSVTSYGTINGYFPQGVGLRVSFAANTYSSGLITGAGAGPHRVGGPPQGYAGGAAAVLAGGTFVNNGAASGGYASAGLSIPIGGGGNNGAAGGVGGCAVELSANGVVLNSGDLMGGAGGSGGGGNSGTNGYGYYYHARAGDGGAGGAGLILAAGGSVTNTGTIIGGPGGAAGVASDKYTYAGYAGAQGFGVWLQDGGEVTNGDSLASKALISGGVYAKGAAATVVNTGMIEAEAYGYGVYLGAGGRVTNGAPGVSSALITKGVNFGSSVAATVVNYGTIEGGSFFGASGDRFIAEPGSYSANVFVNGGLIAATLELASGAEIVTSLGASATITGALTLFAQQFSTYQVDAADSLTLSGASQIRSGASLIGEGQLTLLAATTLTVGDGGLVEIAHNVANAGDIALMSVTKLTDLHILAAGASLSGAGTVTLSGPKARILGASTSAVLTNLDNTITGQGFIGLGSMTLVNQAKGLIEAIGKQGLVVNTKGVTSSNAGVMESASGSTLVLQNSTFDQSGGGTIAALTGGRVDLEDDVILGGSLSQAGTGVMNINVTGGELKGVSLTGTAQVLGGMTETLDGAMANAGKLVVFGGAKLAKLVVGSDGLTLSGGGQLNLSASPNNTIVGAASGDVLTNVDNRIAGAGDIGAGSMGLNNEAKGLIVGNTNQTLTIDTGASTITNAGGINAQGTGQVIVKSALANAGTLLAASGTLTLDGAVSGAGVAQISKGILNIAATFGETVSFLTGATGELRLTDFKDFTGTVKGLSTAGANSIDLIGFTLTGAKATFSGTTAGGTLTVSNGTQTAKITLAGDYVGHSFTVSNDGHGGVLVKDPPTGGGASLAQAMASFQYGPAPHLAGTPAFRLQRAPIWHVRA